MISHQIYNSLYNNYDHVISLLALAFVKSASRIVKFVKSAEWFCFIFIFNTNVFKQNKCLIKYIQISRSASLHLIYLIFILLASASTQNTRSNLLWYTTNFIFYHMRKHSIFLLHWSQFLLHSHQLPEKFRAFAVLIRKLLFFPNCLFELKFWGFYLRCWHLYRLTPKLFLLFWLSWCHSFRTHLIALFYITKK